ncbi:MAG: tetratricopeptide repeat protein [Alphaproteobacteria bacterium]|nr:tetratricopeptide repeat protein [Alphaproteobacteria bacterium]
MSLFDRGPNEKLTRKERSVLEEVNEDIASRRRVEFWKDYGPWIAGGIVAGLLVLGGVEFFRHGSKSRIDRDSADFLAAMAMLGGPDSRDAVAGLDQIAARGHTGFASLSKIYAALNSGDEAVPLLQQAALDRSIPKVWRELASISAAYRMVDNADIPARDIGAQLDNIGRNSQFAPAAAEVRGLVAIREADNESAKKWFAMLAGMEDAPPKMRARAQKMLEGL